MKKKGLVIAASVMLVLCLAVGGTLAWLMDTTGPVVNTFTYGDVNITLDEADTDNSTADKDRDQANSYKMVPGNIITKDPKVTVEANSEACWLFVEVAKSANFDNYLTYDIADGWKLCSQGLDGTVVYGRIVNKATAANGTSYYVIKDNTVTVKDTVTKVMMNAIDGIVTEEDVKDKTDSDGNPLTVEKAVEMENAARPTLTFKAYAVQLEAAGDADTLEEAPAAWTAVKDLVA